MNSPANSMKGYSFWKWFKGNGKTIKELFKVGVPLIISWLVTQNPAWTGVCTVIGKLIIDGVEFYFSRVDL